MSRIRLTYQGASALVQGDGLGLLMLVDEQQHRQLIVPCNGDVLRRFDFGRRGSTTVPLTDVLWHIIRSAGTASYELLFTGVADGHYLAVLRDAATGTEYSLRDTDAVYLSAISSLPIYIDRGVMDRQGGVYRPGSADVALPINMLDTDMLERALDKAVGNEDYELASHLRDELNHRKTQRDTEK